LHQDFPSQPFHSPGLVRTSLTLNDPDWIWWSLPRPNGGVPIFADLCERDAPCDPPSKTRELCAMLSPVNRRKLDAARRAKTTYTSGRKWRPYSTARNTFRRHRWVPENPEWREQSSDGYPRRKRFSPLSSHDCQGVCTLDGSARHL
jgi:hypothetical protein